MLIDELRRFNLYYLAEEFGGVGKLAEVLGKDPSQVSQWINGSKNSSTGKPRGMRSSTCREIEKKTRKPMGWLDTDHVEPPPQTIFDANAVPVHSGDRRIPLLNYVQAGLLTDMGSNFPTEDMDYLLTDLSLSGRAFALEIKGESMLPDFKEGDRIIVDCEVSPRPGDFVVAKNTTEEATFKKYRLVKVDDRGQEVFELIPLNPDYPTVRSDEQHLHIIGTMVEHRKYFRR